MKSSNGKRDAPRVSHSLNGNQAKTMVKFILLGECGVGKTSILNRFCDGRFTRNTTATIGVDFKYRDIQLDGEEVRLHVWDTAGQEQFRVVSKPYYRQADGAVLVYDCTNPPSMAELEHYLDEARDLCPMGVALAVVGNKADLKTDKGCVSTLEGSTFAKRRGVPLFFEASAANGEGIDNAFEVLCRYAMNSKRANNELRATSVGSGRGAPKKAALQPKDNGNTTGDKKRCNC